MGQPDFFLIYFRLLKHSEYYQFTVSGFGTVDSADASDRWKTRVRISFKLTVFLKGPIQASFLVFYTPHK